MNNYSLKRTLTAAPVYLILLLAAALFVFPFLYVLGLSLTPVTEALKRSVVIVPHEVTFAAYRQVFLGGAVIHGYKVTLERTIMGTLLNMIFTVLTAYPLSKKMLPGRSGVLFYIVFTMLFSGGLIPTYILVQSLGLTDTIWALIMPGLVSVFNMLVMKNFFEQLPAEIEESAKIDGAGEALILTRIIMPLSLPILATVSLFYAVYHWNSWFDAVMYINRSQLDPLQIVLRNILINSQTQIAGQLDSNQPISTITLQMATIIVATVPILCVYPFVQKYFVKGVLIGSVKG